MEREKNDNLQGDVKNYDQKMQVSAQVRQDCESWLDHIHNVFAPIRRKAPEVLLHTDASTQGWGAYIPSTGQQCGGR